MFMDIFAPTQFALTATSPHMWRVAFSNPPVAELSLYVLILALLIVLF